MKRTVHVNRETVNAMLPSIPPDFERDMRDMILSMPAERKELPMRKKLSVGLILVLVSLLLAGCALAATLLGGKEFVDRIVAPKAAQTDSDRFTPEEVREILRIARENDLVLDDDTEERLLSMRDGYYKEELMRLFVKQEYGRQPAAWPIEVQHWYDEMLNACGQGDGYVYNVLPGEGEITEEEAVNAALAYIRAHWDQEADAENEALYTRFLTYTETVLNPYLRERKWMIEYIAKDLYHADYLLYISPDGEVKDAQRTPSPLSGEWNAGGIGVGDRIARKYENVYGVVEYDTAVMIEYQELLEKYLEERWNAQLTAMEKHILNQRYVLPDAAMLSSDQAVARAKEACGKMDYANLYRSGETALCMEENGRTVWKVTLFVFDTPDRSHWDRVWAEMDARTGEILSCDTALETPTERGGLWRWAVTEAYWLQNKPAPAADRVSAEPAATVRPDGKPLFWGDETVAPQWYWDRLDRVGFTGETASALLTRWENEYGLDPMWWPLEAQAVMEIHDMAPDLSARYASQLSICGLPGDTDLSREQAEAIARRAFTAAYGEREALEEDEWLSAVSFYFRSPDVHTNSWLFRFLRPDTCEMVGFVSLNAADGEVNGMGDGADADFPMVEDDRPISTPAPQADGKPWMWGMDFETPEFWAQLEKTMAEWGVTFGNIEEKTEEWSRTYTDAAGIRNRQFDPWPQDCVVMRNILCGLDAEDPSCHAVFPREGGVTQEQALEIARQALRAACDRAENAEKAIVTEAWQAELIPFAVLWRQPEPDWHGVSGDIWVVQFMHWENSAYETRAWVYVSQDGEVLDAELDLYGNG